MHDPRSYPCRNHLPEDSRFTSGTPSRYALSLILLTIRLRLRASSTMVIPQQWSVHGALARFFPPEGIIYPRVTWTSLAGQSILYMRPWALHAGAIPSHHHNHTYSAQILGFPCLMSQVTWCQGSIGTSYTPFFYMILVQFCTYT